jgi:hypothetical protein
MIRESGVTSDKMYCPRCIVHRASRIVVVVVVVVLMSGCIVVEQ